jgi:hypothetical protein
LTVKDGSRYHPNALAIALAVTPTVAAARAPC